MDWLLKSKNTKEPHLELQMMIFCQQQQKQRQLSVPYSTFQPFSSPAVVTPPGSTRPVVHAHQQYSTRTPFHPSALFQQPPPLTAQASPSSLFVVLSLKRHNLKSPWGISLTWLQDHLVVVGSVGSNISQQHSEASISCVPTANVTQKPPPEWFHECVTNKSNGAPSRNQLIQLLTQQTSVMGTCYHPPQFQPGDVLLGIDGSSVGEFSGLTDLTHYLKKTTAVKLLMFRNAVAYQRAQEQKSPWEAARVAGGVLRTLLQPSVAESMNSSTLVHKTSPTMIPRRQAPSQPHHSKSKTYAYAPYVVRNPWFRDETTNENIPYCDNDWEFDPEEGHRAKLFLNPACRESFRDWLDQRKRKWSSQCYKVYEITENWVQEEETVPDADSLMRHELSVPVDFWSSRGHANFSQWLRVSTTKWKQGYRWNQCKRRRIEQDCTEIVQLTATEFPTWLRVRKSQWRVLRRKLERDRRECCSKKEISSKGTEKAASTVVPEKTEVLFIDALLEAQERQRREKERGICLDIMALFDIDRGCPDDAVSHCLSFLDPMEHAKLLSIDRKSRKALMKRSTMWRQLCPDHWQLPRRPRKPWHEIYLSLLRSETEQSRKQQDDLLMTASRILLKGDHLQAIEKLVSDAEEAFRFNVNYTSGVVCERNSLLNLAVIHGRHKLVRWLVEVKRADIESVDRGNFTPLMNAAWSGDRYLVRFFLQRGADRTKLGRCHYTRPLASPDFEGYNAEGWAAKQGHDDVARLIHFGL